MKLFIIFSLLIISLCSFAKEEVLHIVSGEYPPWVSNKLKHEGFAHHIISEAFKRSGYKTVYRYYPWARTSKEGNSGKYHATSLWFYSKEREKLFYYSEPISKEDVVFFHLKTTKIKGFDSLDDLKMHRIGATRGYTYTPEFWKAKDSGILNIIVNNSDRINFTMLFKKRIDLFLTATVAGYSVLLNEFPKENVQNITFIPTPLFSKKNHLLFPKKRPDAQQLLKIFNKGLKSIRSDGTYDKFYDKLLEGDYNKNVVENSLVPIRLAYNLVPNPPFNMADHTATKPGVTIEMIREVGNRLKLEFEFRKMPWKRCLLSVKKNIMDGTIDASFNKERMIVGVYPMINGKINISKRNNTQNYSIFTTKLSEIKSFSDLLNNKKVGVNRGYSIISNLQKKGIKKVIETNDTLASLRMLVYGRIDALVDLANNVNNKIDVHKGEFNSIHMLSPPVKSKHYYLLFSHQFYRENTSLAIKIWNTMADIRGSKQYQKLFAKY